MASSPYLGSILIFGGTFTIRGYAQCNGALLNINTNTALFSLLGTTYGGNGQTTFGLPDLRGRVPLGMGSGPGLMPYPLGTITGAERVTLNTSQLPAHTHALTTAGYTGIQTKATAVAPVAGSFLSRSTDIDGTSTPAIYVPAGTAGTQVKLGGLSGATDPLGGSQPFPILQPLLALNFQICTQGIFPSRN